MLPLLSGEARLLHFFPRWYSSHRVYLDAVKSTEQIDLTVVAVHDRRFGAVGYR